MLVQIAVENFRSIETEIVFKMISAPIKEHPSHLTETNFTNPQALLRFGAIYGANASGKTNFIKAVHFAQDLIINGRDFDEPIGNHGFRLTGKNKSSPTVIEFTIWLESQLFTYGFAITNEQVEEEWLYAQRSGAQERKLFERKTEKDHAVVTTGKSLEENDFTGKMLNMIARTTRQNQLYLHELMDKNHPGIRALMDWFGKTLTIIPAASQYRELVLRARKDKKFTNFLSSLLKRVGTGIERVELKGREIDPDRDLIIYPPAIRENIKSSINKLTEKNALLISGELMQRVYEKKKGIIREFQLEAIHIDKNGKEIALPIEEESDGTQRLVHLAPLFADALDQTQVVFIDELDRRLHPLLSKTLIQLFNEVGLKNSSTQLVFSTHDTNLFDQDLLRRDELWLMEKNSTGATQLTSLLDFNIRNDKKLDKNYLLGRFGGIPNIRYEILNGNHAEA